MVNEVSGLLKYETNDCGGLFGMLNKKSPDKRVGDLVDYFIGTIFSLVNPFVFAEPRAVLL